MPKKEKKAPKKAEEELEEENALLEDDVEEVEEKPKKTEKKVEAGTSIAAKGDDLDKAVRIPEQRVPYTDKLARTRKILMEGPQTSFLIPLAPGEKPGAYETVQINGFRLEIRKGAMVTIPVACAEVLAGHYAVSLEAGYGSETRIDRDDRTMDALA